MKKFKSKLIGRRVNIKDNIDSMWAGEWGVIKHYDGDYYHVAIWNGNEQPIFSRNELHIPDQIREAKSMSKTIWYFGQELEFRKEVESRDEAQALIDYETRQGRTACANHYNGKHQIYVSSHEERE